MNTTRPTAFFNRSLFQTPSRKTVLYLATFTLLVTLSTTWFVARDSNGSDKPERDTRTAEELVAAIYDSTIGETSRAEAELNTGDERKNCVDALVRIGSSALPLIEEAMEMASEKHSSRRQSAIHFGVIRGNPRLGADKMSEADARFLPVIRSYQNAIRRIEAGETAAAGNGATPLPADAASRAKRQARAITRAMQAYYDDHARLPGLRGERLPSGDNLVEVDREVLDVLTGQARSFNPQKVNYLKDLEESFRSTSSLKDPWGTPYRLVVDADYDERVAVEGVPGLGSPVPGVAVAISAGPDGSFRTSDDLSGISE